MPTTPVTTPVSVKPSNSSESGSSWSRGGHHAGHQRWWSLPLHRLRSYQTLLLQVEDGVRDDACCFLLVSPRCHHEYGDAPSPRGPEHNLVPPNNALAEREEREKLSVYPQMQNPVKLLINVCVSLLPSFPWGGSGGVQVSHISSLHCGALNLLGQHVREGLERNTFPCLSRDWECEQCASEISFINTRTDFKPIRRVCNTTRTLTISKAVLRVFSCQASPLTLSADSPYLLRLVSRIWRITGRKSLCAQEVINPNLAQYAFKFPDKWATWRNHVTWPSWACQFLHSDIFPVIATQQQMKIFHF